MRKIWMLLFTLIMTVSLAACIAPVASPAVLPPSSPLDQPAPESPLEEPATDLESSDLDAGVLVRQILAQQLQLDLNEIEIVTVEAVEWPDACLGVYTADMMCAQVITPGYRVVLAVDGQQYEYHTNLDGSNVQLASAPEANVGEILIEWQQTQDFCEAAQIGTEGIVFGPCMGVQMGGKLVSSERELELADLVATYAPFETETPAGIVTFHGQGSTEATPAEQRMIAEWSRQAALEASAGRSGASWGLAFAWHREGGIAGFCDDLTVYVTGQVFASSCRDQTPETIGQRFLTAEELEQVYAWVDEYAPFELDQSDPATAADAMSVTLIFSGAGDSVADEETQQAILDFSSSLYAEMSQ